MSRYEIHIPDGDRTRVERVHGDNWLDALRRGLAAAGLPAPNRNLGVAFAPDASVDITDTDAGRTYRVVPVAEATAERPSTGPVPAPIADAFADPFADDDELEEGLPIHPPVQAAAVPIDASRRRKRLSAAAWGPYRRLTRSAPDAPPEPGGLDADDEASDSYEIAPARARAANPTDSSDPLLRDLAALDAFDGPLHDAAALLLDRAMAHVPCVAGSVLLVDPRDRSLYFAAARGSKAEALVAKRLPLDIGLAGHCLRTRRSINVTEPARDPRFARTIAEKIGYLPDSIVCLPIIARRKTFGVLELLDRHGEDGFSTEEEARLRRAARALGAHMARVLGVE